MQPVCKPAHTPKQDNPIDAGGQTLRRGTSGKGGHASICGAGSVPLALGRTLSPEEPPLARDRKLIRPATLSCALCGAPSGPCAPHRVCAPAASLRIFQELSLFFEQKECNIHTWTGSIPTCRRAGIRW